MAADTEAEVVLYDLACIKNVCFSPVVWRIRLMLNYKGIPYRTVFLEFPDIEPTLRGLGIEESGGTPKYTVPAIHHIPTNTYLMGSTVIAEFLESTYQTRPAVPLTSELGQQIETQGRTLLGKTFTISIVPHELNILSPRAQEYFRRTRETMLGRKLEDLMTDAARKQEEEAWNALDEEITALGQLMLTNRGDGSSSSSGGGGGGPFVLGAQPSYTDFFVAGFLESMRVVNEAVFERLARYVGFKDIYEACAPFMQRRD